MSANTCLINRCLSSASAVIHSWFIIELQKSTSIAFSRNSLYSFYSRNPTCEISPHAFRFPIVNTPPPPPSFGIPVQRTLPPLQNPEGCPWYRHGYFHKPLNVKMKKFLFTPSVSLLCLQSTVCLCGWK